VSTFAFSTSPTADLALDDAALVADHRGLDLQGVLDKDARDRIAQLAGVADLAARLGIERRVVEHDDRVVAGARDLDRAAVDIERDDLCAVVGERVVAVERRVGAAVREPLGDLELRCCARLFTLPAHRRLEAGGVDRDAALAADIGRQIEREAVGVVQLERELAAQRAFRPAGRLAFGSGTQLGQFGLEDLHPVRDGLEEAFLLLLQHIGRALLVAPQLRIGLTHFGREVGDELVEERLPAPSL
jgi:hypothetical protein